MPTAERPQLPEPLPAGYPQAMPPAHEPPREVVAAFFAEPAVCEPVEVGHINETYRVTVAGRRYILQRVAAIFPAEVNEDIAALLPALARAGLITCELVPTRRGTLWHTGEAGGTWRVLTHLPGHTLLVVPGPPTARAAGAYLARFHQALAPITHRFVAARRDVHDLEAHQAGLVAARLAHPSHAAAADVARLADEALARLAELPALELGPKRIVHGDAKITNFLFASPTEVVSLIDLDTLGPMELCLELGDALRSWCNQAPDGTSPPTFLLPHFQAACAGYAEGGKALLGPAGGPDLAVATLRISLELTVRFLRDALEESYFAWDRQQFAASWQHQLKRARAQLAFARSLANALPAAQDAAAAAFV